MIYQIFNTSELAFLKLSRHYEQLFSQLHLSLFCLYSTVVHQTRIKNQPMHHDIFDTYSIICHRCKQTADLLRMNMKKGHNLPLSLRLSPWF